MTATSKDSVVVVSLVLALVSLVLLFGVTWYFQSSLDLLQQQVEYDRELLLKLQEHVENFHNHDDTTKRQSGDQCQCKDGVPGPKGQKGDEGPPGPQGDIGLPGPTGDDGRRGLRGEPGHPGDRGPVGAKGDRGARGRRGRVGSRGMTGEKGLKGDTGLPGPFGEPGFEGSKGDKGAQGLPGLTGVKGDQGARGQKGREGSPGMTNTGEVGLRGPVGEPGLKGSKGAKGEQGNTDPARSTDSPSSSENETENNNWNQCFFQSLNSDKDYGLIADCSIMKHRDDTWLRLTWDGNMRIAGCTVCCMNWYLTVDGQQCSSPGPVDALVYQGERYLIVRHSHFTGMCEQAGGMNISAGLHRIQLSLKDCPGFNGFIYNAFTGWNTQSRIIVEEVPPRNPTVTTPATPPPSYTYKPNHCQVGYANLGPGNNRNLGVLTTIRVNKAEDHTVLRITWESNIINRRCVRCCARWFVTIDGSECSFPDKIETMLYSDSNYSIFFPTSITGVCSHAAGAPIGAGVYSIRLEVGQCLGYPIGDLATGFFSTSRFLVEELPMPTTTQISYSSGGGFLPTEPSALVVPDPEVYHPIWHHCTVPNVDNPKDSGSIDETKCSFVKIEDNTDIMVSWDGNLGVESCSDCCGRWFITFNGEECSDPAPIDGIVHLLNTFPVSIHHSSTLTGLCRGTQSGSFVKGRNYSVVLNVENCGNKNLNAFTGLEGVTVMFIEEWPQPRSPPPSYYWPNWNQCVENNLNSQTSGSTSAIQSCIINKQKSDTWLQVSWNGNIGLMNCSTCCMRWYLTIDGNECAYPLSIDAAIYQNLSNTLHSKQWRPGTISGLCGGPLPMSTFSTGDHVVKLYVDHCEGSNESYKVITGYQSVSRFILEEVEVPDSSCSMA